MTLNSAVYKIMTQTNKMEIILIALALIVVFGIGTVILNQRKIRRDLRQLREMMENQDKPQE